MGYVFRIAGGPAPYEHYAYFDTEDHLADFLFAQEQVEVTIEEEFGFEGDPYSVILCRIPPAQREGFLKAIDLLPGLMAYVGRTDYDDFCRNMMLGAARFLEGKHSARPARGRRNRAM